MTMEIDNKNIHEIRLFNNNIILQYETEKDAQNAYLKQQNKVMKDVEPVF